MTAELTSEQIVTNILISNQILRPINNVLKPENDLNLGEFLINADKEKEKQRKNSRYSFIDLDNSFNY